MKKREGNKFSFIFLSSSSEKNSAVERIGITCDSMTSYNDSANTY